MVLVHGLTARPPMVMLKAAPGTVPSREVLMSLDPSQIGSLSSSSCGFAHGTTNARLPFLVPAAGKLTTTAQREVAGGKVRMPRKPDKV